MKTKANIIFLTASLVFTLPACLAGESMLHAAVNHKARPDKDRAVDQHRKPAQVLDFFGLEPGMKVLEFYSANGYYAEIISRALGDEGKIYAQAHSGKYWQEPLEKRFKNDAFKNVSILIANVEEQAKRYPRNELDMVLMILTYHDVYDKTYPENWDVDGSDLLAVAFRALKPSGVLGVVDHHAGADVEKFRAGGILHRINRERAIEEIQAAGFVLEEESFILRNENDDRSQPSNSEAARRKTDRFILKFRKPVG
ncbi:MAG: SAM-dependent methyltransferase [Gammaproteobacteria bacterium]|nr:SAM-dependent methyltransferase [Gammaproteobacteria bacterium]